MGFEVRASAVVSAVLRNSLQARQSPWNASSRPFCSFPVSPTHLVHSSLQTLQLIFYLMQETNASPQRVTAHGIILGHSDLPDKARVIALAPLLLLIQHVLFSFEERNSVPQGVIGQGLNFNIKSLGVVRASLPF